MIPFDFAPNTLFHRRVVISGGAGQLSDGFSVGIIGAALSLAKVPLGLSIWWMGALGAGSLAGLFFGGLIAGPLTDRFGRRPIFNWAMLFFAAFAALQYFSPSAGFLLAVRFCIGITLGFDYVACKAMVSEYSPIQSRGTNLSILALCWTSGYLASFLAGYLMQGGGPGSWRIALLASAAPALLAFLLRVRMPESPLWLVQKGRVDEARRVITKYIGSNVELPQVAKVNPDATKSFSPLFRPPLLQYFIVGCVFYTSQLIPLYALGTYLPIVMLKLGLVDGFAAALIYNLIFWMGAAIGPFIIDRIPRRSLLVYGFLIMAALLAVITIWNDAPPLVTICLFSAFAFVLSVAGILQFVYPPELFPTAVRARGIGGTLVFSRVGTAITTFALPAIVERRGIYPALVFCMAIMIFAAAVCYRWAPETLKKRLG